MKAIDQIHGPSSVTFFNAVSFWIRSHKARVSELPGSRTFFDVIFPNIFSTEWRGISFNNARHTWKPRNRKNLNTTKKIKKSTADVIIFHYFSIPIIKIKKSIIINLLNVNREISYVM